MVASLRGSSSLRGARPLTVRDKTRNCAAHVPALSLDECPPPPPLQVVLLLVSQAVGIVCLACVYVGRSPVVKTYDVSVQTGPLLVQLAGTSPRRSALTASAGTSPPRALPLSTPHKMFAKAGMHAYVRYGGGLA